MHGVFNELEKIIVNPNLSYRILTLSDGDLHDSQETSNKASEFYNKIISYKKWKSKKKSQNIN